MPLLLSGIRHGYIQYCESSGPTKIGEKLSISREHLVDIIVDVFDEINERNIQEPIIADLFRMCGLNPWSQKASLKAFEDHLNSLKENNVMKALLRNQQAVDFS